MPIHISALCYSILSVLLGRDDVHMSVLVWVFACVYKDICSTRNINWSFLQKALESFCAQSANSLPL